MRFAARYSVGLMLCGAPEKRTNTWRTTEPPVRACVQARIYVVHAPRPLLPGQAAVLHMHACSTPCRIAALVSQLDMKTGAVKQSGHRCRFLLQEQAAVVDLQLDESLCVECLPGSSPLSRLVLRIGGAMVAMGTVLEVLDAA